MSATTLVLDDGEAGRSAVFEFRLQHARGSAERSRTTLEEVQQMSIEEQAKGKLEEAKGRGEQAQGDLTGDNRKKGEGMLDEAKGKARQAGDKVREAVDDLTE
jgi:uncharacterized protein YjbJ (UPF0337 family)